VRILHVRDTAGIGSQIAKYTGNTTVYAYKKYAKSFLLKHDLTSDPYHISRFYNTELDDCSLLLFLIKALWKSRHYDVIILHDLPQLIPGIRLLNPKARIVVYYHGTALRVKHAKYAKYDKNADLIVVVTDDLLKYRPNAVHMPNLVDTEHFKPLNLPKKKELLIMRQNNDPIPEELLRYSFDEISRETKLVPYSQMPKLLNCYVLFANPKRSGQENIPMDIWSGLDRQALACGLKVYKRGQWHYGLPEECKPENYIKRFRELVTV